MQNDVTICGVLRARKSGKDFAGVEIPRGWWNLVAQLNRKLATIDACYKVMCVKSDYGLLRFVAYPTHENERQLFSDTIELATRQAKKVCQSCGCEGEQRLHLPLLPVLCAACTNLE